MRQAAAVRKHVAKVRCAAHAHLTGVLPFQPDGPPTAVIVSPPFVANTFKRTPHIVRILVGCGLEVESRQIHPMPAAAAACCRDCSNPFCRLIAEGEVMRADVQPHDRQRQRLQTYRTIIQAPASHPLSAVEALAVVAAVAAPVTSAALAAVKVGVIGAGAERSTEGSKAPSGRPGCSGRERRRRWCCWAGVKTADW